MCGICGVRRFGEAPIQRDMIDLLILNNANRGLEATGVALQQANGEVVIFKDNQTPFEFVASQAYNTFMEENLRNDTITVLGHTRKATTGSPRVIANNHPMFSGKTAVIHNGHISNHEFMFKELKLERKAETDSDVLRAILDKEGFTRKAVNTLSKLSGNAAFAAISPDYPGKLLLGRSGNPIEFAATANHLMFSSETGPLYKAMRPLREVYGILMREMTPIDYYMIGMTDHSAWLLGDKPAHGERTWASNWLEWHQEMTIASNFMPITYTCQAQFHGNRIKFYDDRPIDIIECPKCGLYLSVNEVMLKDLKKFKCAECKTVLG